jgi:hypothetical protein
MGAHRIEIPKHTDTPSRLRSAYCGQHVLDNELRVAVWICMATWKILGNWNSRRVSIHGGATGEDKRRVGIGLELEAFHCPKQADRSAQIVMEVFQGLFAALANSLIAGEVDDSHWLMNRKHPFDEGVVANVPPLQYDRGTGDSL